MMIGRPQNLQGGAPGGGSPSAPPVQQSGGSPIQVNVQSPQMPYVQTPYVQTPQLPYVPQPQVQLPGGGYVQGPRIPQPYIPQPVIPQPTIPQASVTATGSSTNWLLIAIVALVALLVGVALGMFLKK
jgi:hypothetical protein